MRPILAMTTHTVLIIIREQCITEKLNKWHKKARSLTKLFMQYSQI